jgi:peptidyl-dipeptidase Dcp
VKNLTFLLVGAVIILLSFTPIRKEMNPLLSEFKTPYGVPPFDNIENEHFLPAFKKAMKTQEKEIEKITRNQEAPTFENTIAAFDYSGALYTQVSSIFYNIKSANTSDEIQSIAKTLVPLTSAHRSKINMDVDLFARIEAIYSQKEALELTGEQEMLLDKVYKQFVRGGAKLSDKDKSFLKEIDENLSMLTLQFGENLLAETNNYKLVIEKETDLAGLPSSVIASAAEAAAEAGMEGKWVVTLHKPSWIPFLTYSEKRELREEVYKAMYMRANNGNEFDNKKIISEIIKLRTQRAQLLGYESHADYVLVERMSGNEDNVLDLLMKLWTPALKMAKEEAEMMQKLIDRDGGNFELASWDWWYYAEKIRQEKYELEDEALRPYFNLDAVTEGVFNVVKNLYGVSFEKRDDIPAYHEDATAYVVKEADGSFLGVLYLDFFPRASKRAGAWSTSYRKQHKRNGKNIETIGSIVCNFSKPTGNKPALLSYDEALTFFHEMGHAIHGLFSNCTYPGISCTSVPRDFVELPSQIMENWGGHPDVLKSYAKHYETGKSIPDELIKKLEASGKFNMGFVTTEYLAASLLDMKYHTKTDIEDIDVNEFENKAMNEIGLIEEIIPRYKSTYFNHIFASGYSAGYYSYIWSEVLDKDAFNAFVESGNIFDHETAESFRSNILSAGGTKEAMEMYLDFRGKEPDVKALLNARGLN